MAMAGMRNQERKATLRRQLGKPNSAVAINPTAIAAIPISVFASNVKAAKTPARKRRELLGDVWVASGKAFVVWLFLISCHSWSDNSFAPADGLWEIANTNKVSVLIPRAHP